MPDDQPTTAAGTAPAVTTASAPHRPWLARRDGRLGWLLAMPVLLTPPYAITNHLELRPAVEVPRLAIDGWIPFLPEASLVYLGLFPLMWLAVVVQPDTPAARRMVLGAACCAWCAALVFLLAPTTFARPPGTASGVYALVTAVDTPRNACPSLHGTYATYSAAWIAAGAGRPWLGWLAAAGALAILLATIAVRQHGTIDLALGGLLGIAAFAWWRRGAPATGTPA